MSLPLLNIVTPVSRPHNLGAMRESIIRSAGSFFIIRWYCIYDAKLNLPIHKFADDWIISKQFGNNASQWGNDQRNHALDLIKDGWCCFLDDDNLMHPDFGRALSEKINGNHALSGYIFSQQRDEKTVLMASPKNMEAGKIDVAQVLFHKKMITARFRPLEYAADWYFIEAVYGEHYDKILFINEILCSYNRLNETKPEAPVAGKNIRISNDCGFHYEVIESVFLRCADIIKTPIGKADRIYVDFFAGNESGFYKGKSFAKYFSDKYPEIKINQSEGVKFDYFIYCTLDCESALKIFNSKRENCFFICHLFDKHLVGFPNVYFLSPLCGIDRWFIPASLPAISKIKTKIPVYCIQGRIDNPKSRNFSLLKKILNEKYDYDFRIKILGACEKVPQWMEKHKDKLIIKSNLDFIEYHREFSDVYCIFPCITPDSNPQYYTAQLTSSISYGMGYDLYFLADKKLKNLYSLEKSFVFNDERDIVPAFSDSLKFFYETASERISINGVSLFISDHENSSTARTVKAELESGDYNLSDIAFESGDIVMDIGANTGVFSCYLAKKYPHIKILAYEPQPDNFKNLLHNIKINNIHNVIAYNYAIGGEDGWCETIYNTKNTGNSKVRISDNGIVEMKSLYELMGKIVGEAGRKIKLLKVDVEGFEHNIFGGNKSDIEKRMGNAIDYLSIEIHGSDTLHKKFDWLGDKLWYKHIDIDFNISNNWFINSMLKYGIKCPETIVETGTYLGGGISNYLGAFKEIHSIELSKKYYQEAKKKFSQHKNVHLYLGESHVILNTINLPEKPCLFFLDAHYAGGNTAGSSNYIPVIEEIKAIKKRRIKGDIIVIDDMQIVGKKVSCGGTPDYPLTEFDWTHISVEDIMNAATPDRFIMADDVDRLILVL